MSLGTSGALAGVVPRTCAKVCLACGLILAAVFVVSGMQSPARASAQTTAWTTRLGFDALLFSHESTHASACSSTTQGDWIVDDVDTVTNSYGFERSMFGLNLGVGLGDSFV